MRVRGRGTSVSVGVTEQTPFGHRCDVSNKIPCHMHQPAWQEQLAQVPRWREEGRVQEEKRGGEVSTASQDSSLAPWFLGTIEPLCALHHPGGEAWRPLLCKPHHFLPVDSWFQGLPVGSDWSPVTRTAHPARPRFSFVAGRRQRVTGGSLELDFLTKEDL